MICLNNLCEYYYLRSIGQRSKDTGKPNPGAGFRSVIWNATNDYGKPVSAGVYLYQIQAGEFVQTKKMVLLK